MSWRDLTAFTYDYAVPLLTGAGLLGLALLLALVAWARRTKRPLRPIALAVSMNLALLLNAEGMWVIAVGTLQLPPLFAVLVFAVFELCFLTATSLAAEQYRNTTVYGRDGTVLTPGHPGPMVYVAALIAVVSGLVVASNAHTGTEKVLRLAIPCVVFLMWWAALTAAGQRARRSRFAYSPRRLAERWGWLIPDDDPDLAKVAAERRLNKMAMLAHRLHNGDLDAAAKAKLEAKLAKLSLNSTTEALAEVQRRVSRASQAERLTRPDVLAELERRTAAAAAAAATEAGTQPAPIPAVAVTAASVEPAPRRRTPESAVAAGTSGRINGAKPDDSEPMAPAPRRAAAPKVPQNERDYRRWLTVWQAIEQARKTNTDVPAKTLAAEYSVSPRLVTEIRKAGQEGLLTEERLTQLRGQKPAAEEPAAPHQAPVPAPSAADSDVVEGPGQSSLAMPQADALVRGTEPAAADVLDELAGDASADESDPDLRSRAGDRDAALVS